VSFPFPPNHRVRQSKDFERAFRHKGLTNKWFTLHISESNSEFARLGMVVSKRIIPKSVCRNYAKRVIREVFRHNSSNFATLDFIVRIRRRMTKASSGEAREALSQLLAHSKTL